MKIYLLENKIKRETTILGKSSDKLPYYPVENIKTPSPQIPWRTSGLQTTNEYISFDLAEAETLDYVRALGSNINDYHRIYVEGADDENFTENLTTEYLSGAEFKAGHFISQISKRYLRFRVYDGVCFVGTSGGSTASYDSCITSGKIYIPSNNRVSIFDEDSLSYLGYFGSSGSGDGQFSSPKSICSDGSYLYTVETGNHRIQKFTLSGQFVSKIGSQGSGNDQFYNPNCIRYYDSKLYIADMLNNRIKIHLASDLSYVDSWSVSDPRSVWVDTTNQYLIVKAWSGVCVYKLSDKSLVRSQISLAGGWGCCLVESYLYLTDTINHKIIKYNYSDFSYVGEYAPGQGSSPGQLDGPFHLYYWADKNLILCGNSNSPYYIVGITPGLKFQSNEDGYIQIGHILASEKKSFERSAVTAFSEKYDDKSVKIETENLVVYHVVKEPIFQVALSIDHLKREDADMLKEFFFDHGIHTPFSLYIEDQLRGNYTIDNVVFREIPEIVYRFYDNFSVSFRLREVK